MAVYDEGFAPTGGASRAGIFVNYAGAALSLTLILGVSYWGYQLIMRDVSGIPVVRAMEGDMRVLPDNPGGDVALHTGLSVNEVAAIGEAGGPEDRLVLAPATSGLAQEDLEAQPTAEIIPASIQTDTPVAAQTAPAQTPMSTDDILALADEVAADATSLVQAEPAVDVIPASVPGVARSLRPLLRPASLQAIPVSAPAAPIASNNEVAISTASFPAGTDLVQLGAFRSPDIAATQWSVLEGSFGQLMAGRERVIQVSNQTGGTWYRLRASGFGDRAEAQRFCAALEAEGADCIAVVVD